ncbi:MAG: nuclear transport factor 2 family protein [Anaerolineaceae bacterium]|nr:nuclear transport factor 2 family protein [Anaerolineaceae bacterium]
MSKSSSRIFFLFAAVAFIFVGCSQDADDASQPVHAYLEALVSQDIDQISNLVCTAWEEQAILEVDAFMGVDAALEDVSCTQTEADEDSALVECKGKIVATYNVEQQELPLDGRFYVVTREGGEWRVCGYP